MSRHALVLSLGFVFLLVLGAVQSASAVDYYVNGTTGSNSWDGLAPAWDGTHGPKKTIQAGLDAASDGDTVTVADGTYTGDGNRDLNFHGKAITLQSENGATACIIDCEGDGDGFYFDSGEAADSVVDGFTIMNGKAGWGGGIYCCRSSPTISNCTVMSAVGWGIFCDREARPKLSDCVMGGNHRGGISCRYSSSPVLTGCTISGNSGRAVYCLFSSSPVLTGCTISANAGGISCDSFSSPVLTNCAISGNSGTGICCSSQSHAALMNCTIIGNLLGLSSFRSSNPELINCTIAGNVRYGVYCDSSSVTLTNCIVWGNKDGELHGDDESFLIVEYCDVQGGWAGGTGNIDADPHFFDATHGDGDCHLRQDSPCIDRGTEAGAPVKDMDGEARWDMPGTEPDPSIVDIGADEFFETDSDGMPDWWERRHFGSPTGAEAACDEDSDGLTNLEEYENRTDPWNGDTDGDGRSDGQEVAAGTNPVYPDNPEKTWYVNGDTGDDAHDGLAAAWDGVHGPKATIQAGIAATLDGWDYTVLVADGTYTGDSNRDLDLDGKAITVRSEDGPSSCIIDCEGSARGFIFQSGETAASVVDGFTITNGQAFDGGGIYCSNSSPTITNCTITDSSASRSGGGGGGIYCWFSSPTITNCTITNGQASDGGGIYCSQSSPTITNCTISGNEADWYGGGIKCCSSSLTINNCTISGNKGLWGGAITCFLSSLTIINSKITGNEAVGDGGGICCTTSITTIVSCTVRGNEAGWDGGGIYCFDSSMTVTNSILWGDSPQEIHVYSGAATLSYCDVQGGWPGEGNTDADPLLRPDGHLLSGSPCVDWCPDGPTEDMDGEARPFGSGYDIGADEFVDTDGDGLPDWWERAYFGSPTAARPWRDDDHDRVRNIREYEWVLDPFDADTDDDGRCDGRELRTGTNPCHPDNREKTFYVNDATGDDTWDGLAPSYDGAHGPKRTIQAGIAATVTGWGYTVLVADGTYTGDGNRDLDFGGKAITLRSANGAEHAIINCEGSESDRHRGFDFHSRETADSVVDGFTIQNGYALTGGGIYCYNSSPTITNCTVTGNSSSYYYSGGGIFCWNSNATITNCTVTGNSSSSGSGGGILCGDGDATITNCTITGNSAEDNGGGIYCLDSSATITNCAISGNEAGSDGGGIYYCCVSSPTTTNCTISGNGAGCDGGGIYCYYSSPTITNCTIISNSAASFGGGIYCRKYSYPTMANCILWTNMAPTGHEIALRSTDYPSTLVVRYSDVQGGAAEAYVGPGSTLDMDASNMDADPLFVDAAGGDLRLRYGSPCIDAGTSDGAPERDIEGAPRWDERTVPNTGGGAEPWYDMGAYEFYRGKRFGHLWPHPRKGPKHHWRFWRCFGRGH